MHIIKPCFELKISLNQPFLHSKILYIRVQIEMTNCTTRKCIICFHANHPVLFCHCIPWRNLINQLVFYYRTYSADTDRSLFPVNSVDIYYKLENDRSNKWTLWKSVAPSNTSFEDVIPNAPAQSYSVRWISDSGYVCIYLYAASWH